MSTNSKHVPMRRCIGCGESKEKAELLRFVLRDGIIVPDSEKKLPGRGFYLEPCMGCFEQAMKRKAFNRILRRPISDAEQETVRNAFPKTTEINY